MNLMTYTQAKCLKTMTKDFREKPKKFKLLVFIQTHVKRFISLGEI